MASRDKLYTRHSCYFCVRSSLIVFALCILAGLPYDLAGLAHTSRPAIYAHARSLTDANISDEVAVTEVRTADELKAAIQAGKSHIHFAATVTLTETLFPEACSRGLHIEYQLPNASGSGWALLTVYLVTPLLFQPLNNDSWCQTRCSGSGTDGCSGSGTDGCREPAATCHISSSDDAQSFRACAPDAVVYSAPAAGSSDLAGDGSINSTGALWTAEDNVVLDARYLFRGIHLQRDLEIRGVTIAQIVDDHNPYFFLFGALNNPSAATPVSLTISDSFLNSQCGGRRGPHMDQILSDAFPNAGKTSAGNSVSSRAAYETFAPIHLTSPTGTETVTVRGGDNCQRANTFGADYRGSVNFTVGGSVCKEWGSYIPREPIMTEHTLPEFGVGQHNFCRNPDRSEGGVWCYAAHNNTVSRELCNVPDCTAAEETEMNTAAAAAATATSSTSEATPQTQPDSSTPESPSPPTDDSTETTSTSSGTDSTTTIDSSGTPVDTTTGVYSSQLDSASSEPEGAKKEEKKQLGTRGLSGVSAGIAFFLIALFAVVLLYVRRKNPMLGRDMFSSGVFPNPFSNYKGGKGKDPEQRALTTNSLSFLHRPAGVSRQHAANDSSRGEDSDSAVDSDSETEDLEIFSVPRKPSDCVTHKVALPSLSLALQNVPLPSPRGWETPRDRDDNPLSDGEKNPNKGDALPAAVDQFDTDVPDEGMDEFMGECLLSGSLPMPLDKMSRSHLQSFSVSDVPTHECNSQTSCTQRRCGSFDMPARGTVPKEPAPLTSPSPTCTIFNSSGVAVGESVLKSATHALGTSKPPQTTRKTASNFSLPVSHLTASASARKSSLLRPGSLAKPASAMHKGKPAKPAPSTHKAPPTDSTSASVKSSIKRFS